MAKAKASTTNPEIQKDSPTIEIVRADTCPASSGKSILSYHVGLDEDDTVYLKVAGNDGGGFFSNEWIRFAHIQTAVSE